MNFDIIAVRLAFDKNAYWCKNIESHADRKEKHVSARLWLYLEGSAVVYFSIFGGF